MIRLLALCAVVTSLGAADFRAGVARRKITPEVPIWMSGFAARKVPADGVLHDLWAKALALEDSKGGRAVIVTTDLIGLPRSISDEAAARLQKDFGLERSRMVFNSSHTHSGPVLRANLNLMYDLKPDQWQRIADYSRRLTDDLVSVAAAALGKLEPARMSFGQGAAGFAVNRRQMFENGYRIGVNPNGPTDHSVPVVRVAFPDGRLMAVLFGYACHNTTLTAEFTKINGDYAGFAQIEVERSNPGATAMFLMLCGADQNTNPRSKVELAEAHGRALAAEVNRVLAGKLQPVHSPIRSAYQTVEPSFKVHTRETFERELSDSNPFVVRRAKLMLQTYDDRHPIRSLSYPVQALRFGKDLTLVALGGEVVVDYALRIKRQYPKESTIVAGYSNEVMCYIPSQRVLTEGGYEAADSMIYYGQPGPFNEDVEQTVFSGVQSVLARVGRSAGR